MNEIAKKLFETEAMRVADPENPFWYTSGKLGPYFINTHFLYGNAQTATELLNKIDQFVTQPLKLVKELSKEINEFYHTNLLYRTVMNEFVLMLEENKIFQDCDGITGGERRDWFFSIMAAKLTGKKHYFIWKDCSIYDEKGKIDSLKGRKIAHIADLVTEASSYERAWIPAVEALGGKMVCSASMIDRDQGGKELLNQRGVMFFSPVRIQKEFFDAALKEGILTEGQHQMIVDFMNDPDSYGVNFLKNHPDYIAKSIHSGDEGVRKKAQRCLEKDPYHLGTLGTDLSFFGL